MKVRDFHYCLPEELIAQKPLDQRDMSRLMILDKKTGEIIHAAFRDVTAYLRAGDCLVLNDTRVMPARLFGYKQNTGGRMEFLLLKRIDRDRWRCWKTRGAGQARLKTIWGRPIDGGGRKHPPWDVRSV